MKNTPVTSAIFLVEPTWIPFLDEVNDRRLPTDVVASPTLVERQAPANQPSPPGRWNTASSFAGIAEAPLDRQGRMCAHHAPCPGPVMTTFPRACPPSRYRMASGASSSGYVLSMTGVTFPDSMSSLRTIRSSWFSLLTNVPGFWPTRGTAPSPAAGDLCLRATFLPLRLLR